MVMVKLWTILLLSNYVSNVRVVVSGDATAVAALILHSTSTFLQHPFANLLYLTGAGVLWVKTENKTPTIYNKISFLSINTKLL